MTKLKNKTRCRIILLLWTIMVMGISGCSLTHNKPEPDTGPKPEMVDVKPDFNADKPEENHINLARQLIEKRYYDVALRQLQTAHRDSANRSAELYYLMGVCHRESERYVQAAASFNAAVDRDRDFSFAYNGLGLTHALTGQDKKALDYFLKAIALNPARPDFYNNAGYLEMKQGQYEKAKSFFIKALSIEPGFEQAVNNLAICLGMTGKEDEALEMLLKIHPLSTAYSNMGVIFQMRGKDKKAADMFEKQEKTK